MAERLNLGDLVYRLGFDNEQEFLSALNDVLEKTERAARTGGEAGGRAFGRQFNADATESVRDFPNTFGKSLGLTALGTFIGNALANAFQNGMQVIQQFARDSRQEFQSYQIALNTLATSGVSDLASMREQIKLLSDEGKVFSENQIAQALSEMIKAGLGAADALELVQRSMSVARAEIDPTSGALGDLRTITLQLSDVLAGFNISTTDSARAVDVLAQGALDSKLSISELSAAIGPIGNLAKTAGLSLEQTVATLAKLRDSGITASESATLLRTVLQAAITPAAQYREQMQQLGVTIVKADGQIRPFPELLANIERIANQGGRGLEFLSTVFGNYGVNAAISLSRSRVALEEQSIALSNSAGAARAFGDQMLAGIEPTIALEAQLANARRELGEQLQPVLVSLYRDVLPTVVSGVGVLVVQLGNLLQSARAIVDWYNSNASVIRRQAADQTQARYTDPLRGVGIENAIAETEKKLAAAQQKLQNLSGQFIANTAGQLMRQSLQREVAELQKQLEQYKQELRAITRREFIDTPRTQAVQPPRIPPPARPTSATSNVQVPRVGRQPAARASDAQPAAKASDAVIASIRAQTDALRDAQNKLKLAGGLEAALGNARVLTQYRNELQQIEQQLERLSSRATNAERKRELNAALVQVREAQQQIANAQRDAAQQNARARLEAAKRESQIIAEQLETENRAAAAIEAEKQQRDLEMLKEEERQRAEAVRQNDAMAAALLERARQNAELENREREQRLQSAREEQNALQALEQNAQRAALNAQRILSESAPDAVDFADGIAGIAQQFDALRVQFATGAIDAQTFESEIAALLSVLESFRDESGRAGNVQLFDAANNAAKRLTDTLDELQKIVGAPIAGLDSTALGKLAGDLQSTASAADILQSRIESLEIALSNLSDDPLEITDWLADIDDELFNALEELDERIALLAPEDAELARLLELRQQIERIIALRSELNMPGILALEANLDHRRGERELFIGSQNQQPIAIDYSSIEQELSSALSNAARGFIEELTDGTPDLGAALRRVLQSPAEFFINRLIDGIIGPFADELAKTIARNTLASNASGALALGPAGLAIAGIALVGSLIGGLFGGGAQPASQEVQRDSFGPSSVQTRIETAVSVYLEGNLENPRTRAEIENLAENITLRVLRRLRLVD